MGVFLNKKIVLCFYAVMCIGLSSCVLPQKVRSVYSKLTAKEAPSLLQGTVVTRSNIRVAPSKTAQILKTVDPGTVVWVEQEIDGWYQLNDENNQKAYIYHSLVDLPDKTSLKVAQAESKPVQAPTEEVGPDEVFDSLREFYSTKNANMRRGPGTHYDPPVGSLARGDVFRADGRTGSWYYGSTSNTRGWVHASLLSSSNQAISQKPAVRQPSHEERIVKREADTGARTAARQNSTQDSGMASMAGFAGGMMKWGGEIAGSMAESMPEGSAARDALKVGAAVYTDMGTAVEAAAAEEAANPQGDVMLSMANIGGRAMQAGGQAASRAAQDMPDSPIKDMAKVGGAAYSQAGSAVQSAVAEEAANPQGGGMMSMAKIGGSAMQAGGQAASRAADGLPSDSLVRGAAGAGGEAYAQAGAAVQAAAAGDAQVSQKQPVSSKARITADVPVMVRASASLFAPVVHEAAPDSVVTVLEQTNDWCKIRIDKTIGYVRNNELSK